MILVGPYDSPFVRRVAVALNILGLRYDHHPWSAFGDAERVALLNPLRRVPALVLDGGEVLIDSTAILDHLDEIAGEARLIASGGPQRRTALRVCAIATGLCDKMVSLLYEQLRHDTVFDAWTARCRFQIEAAIPALETARAECETPFWFGPTPGHADIAVTCALRFLAEAHPRLDVPARRPRLASHAAACEAMPAFAAAVQPFTLPRTATVVRG
ncbi:glutathione S-transferase family protein [Falsiroseomonas sp. HW251]|uniref:glutathione S-transferase family protein n=1 Tax=Falsiroseomonas sp. HW251 TaxID=3390998 RepID=UPI003D30F9F9